MPNEKKYIDVEKLKSFIDCGHLRRPTEICFSELDVCNMIDKQPNADVAEVKHGRWIDNTYYAMHSDSREGFFPDDDYICCSNCHFSLNKLDNCVEEFVCCPYCGAKMDAQSQT